MPKKFTGENSKSAEARSRKNEVKNEERARTEKAKEDAYWADDDKQAAKKQQRKEEQEKKKLEALAKKQDKNRLYEEEMNAITTKPSNPVPSKITIAKIESIKQKEIELKKQQEEERRLQAQKIVKPEETLHENLNKLVIEGEARNVDEAIAVLEDQTQSLEMHPEKRMKAAYAAFENRRLPELKDEKPTLRLSQLKQLLKKEWMKSPENPLNERLNLVK